MMTGETRGGLLVLLGAFCGFAGYHIAKHGLTPIVIHRSSEKRRVVAQPVPYGPQDTRHDPGPPPPRRVPRHEIVPDTDLISPEEEARGVKWAEADEAARSVFDDEAWLTNP